MKYFIHCTQKHTFHDETADDPLSLYKPQAQKKKAHILAGGPEINPAALIALLICPLHVAVCSKEHIYTVPPTSPSSR